MPKRTSHQGKKVVLITGTTDSGRDEYVEKALPLLEEKRYSVGYYRVIHYMQDSAKKNGIGDLETEFYRLPKDKLDKIRNASFRRIAKDIHKSRKRLIVVSTPDVTPVTPNEDYPTGMVECLNLKHMRLLNPDLTLVFIDDLLRMRRSMRRNPCRKSMLLTLKELAQLRARAVQVVEEGISQLPNKDWLIFAREHPTDRFIDLLVGKKKRLYVSYHITGTRGFKDITRFMNKLSKNFVCIDPDTIKDWEIVKAYDRAREKGRRDKISIHLEYRSGNTTFTSISMGEIEGAIAPMRAQIVHRDFCLILSTHATVIYHRAAIPSYGIMGEIIHATRIALRRVYVLYPFIRRPSPFFEDAVSREPGTFGGEAPASMVQGDAPRPMSRARRNLEEKMMRKLKRECKLWNTPRVVPL